MKTLLDKFSKLTGFPAISVSDSGTARLAFSGGLTIDLEWPAGNGLHLVSNGIALDEPGTAILARALAVNAPTAKAFQPVLSLQAQDLIVHLTIPENEICEEVLAQGIEIVLETVEQWQEIVRGEPGDDPNSTSKSHAMPNWQMRA